MNQRRKERRRESRRERKKSNVFDPIILCATI
jgi:hypothetical protein